MIPRRPLDVVVERLEGVKANGTGFTARCPAHEDRHNSLSITEGDDGRALLHCFAGCNFAAVVAAMGLQPGDLFTEGPAPTSSASSRSRDGSTAGPGDGTPGLTLARYAAAKCLPVDILRGYGLADTLFGGYPAVAIPYHNLEGEAGALRIRRALHKGAQGDDRFLWRPGSKPTLYGLERLTLAREAGYAVLVEGESDCHTLWYRDIPALGLPGANGWRDDRDAAHLAGIGTIYVVVEPDQGGETVRARLGESTIRERVRFVTLGEHKDPSGLYLADPAHFAERFRRALATARPWSRPTAPPLSTSRIIRAGDAPLAPPAYLIDGVLPVDSLAALVAKPASYKSFVAIDLAASVFTGRAWAGRAVRRGTVLYLVAEGAAGIRRRLRAWEIAHGADLADLDLLPAPTNFLDAAEVARLEGEIAALDPPPSLIVVDTLNRNFGGGKENEVADMSRFFATCDRLRVTTGACVLVVHHERKDGGYRGSSAFEAFLDTLIGVKREERAVALTCHKQKEDDEFAPLHFAAHVVELGLADHQGAPITSLVLRPVAAGEVALTRPGAAERALTPNERTALDALNAAPDRRLRRSDWERASGLASSSFDRAARGLLELGKVGKLEGGGFTPTPIGTPPDPRNGTTTPMPLGDWGAVGVTGDEEGAPEGGGYGADGDNQR